MNMIGDIVMHLLRTCVDISEFCGNGILDENEECDCGSMCDSDACCNADCTLTAGSVCR